MQGRKERKPQLFYTLSPERSVPEDHELRGFAAVLRLDWLRGATAGQGHGREPGVSVVPGVRPRRGNAEPQCAVEGEASEPFRVSRRLQFVRGWGHGKADQVFAGST